MENILYTLMVVHVPSNMQRNWIEALSTFIIRKESDGKGQPVLKYRIECFDDFIRVCKLNVM